VSLDKFENFGINVLCLLSIQYIYIFSIEFSMLKFFFCLNENVAIKKLVECYFSMSFC